jgi:hypothetical protein
MQVTLFGHDAENAKAEEVLVLQLSLIPSR